MGKTILIMCALSVLTLTSCVKDELYNTPHPGKGVLVVAADFTERTEGNAVPDEYVVSVAGIDCAATSDAAVCFPELLPAGRHPIEAYNNPECVGIEDGIAAVDVLPDGTIEALPQVLYTYSGMADVAADDTVRITMPMGQRMRDLYIKFTVTEGDAGRLVSVDGSLSGVAGSFDVGGGTVGGAMTVAPGFEIKGDCVEGHVRLLGMSGGMQTLSMSIIFNDGTTQTVESDVSGFLQNFNADMLTPLELRGNLLLPLASGFNFTITDIETGDVENVELY